MKKLLFEQKTSLVAPVIETAETTLQSPGSQPASHTKSFHEQHVLHELKHYLPAQSALKDFIHHNSLHAFQHLKFYQAIFKAAQIFGYQVTLQLQEYRHLYQNGRIKPEVLTRVIRDRKGGDQVAKWKDNLMKKDYDDGKSPRIGQLRAHWNAQFGVDLDSKVQPLLFRVLCSYLDQGISLWPFPTDEKGFLSALRSLESNGFASFFKTKRARNLLLQGPCTIPQLLEILVGREAYFEQYLFDQQFSHQGWSGIVSAIEDHPGALLDHRKITLQEVIVFELLLEIDALDAYFGNNWEPLCYRVASAPLDLFADVPHSELQDVFTLWQEAFEWSYYDEVLAGMQQGLRGPQNAPESKSFQAIFCIDERECSLRRHIEHVDPECETLGAPGFFGVEFYFQPKHGQFYEKLCPAPVTPKYLIKEYGDVAARAHELLYTRQTHTLFPGVFLTLGLGFLALGRTLLNLFRPVMSPAISNAYAHMNEGAPLTLEHQDGQWENNLQIGFTVDEMATRVAGQLKGMGLIEHFAPLVYVIAHGSSSANNPHHGAHDCGACSGRPGSVNARVFAAMANHTRVREILYAQGIKIPDRTQFVGGLHDTASDEIRFFDLQQLTERNAALHQQNASAFEHALDLNAKERSRRFASINSKMSIPKIRKAIKNRSVSLFEPRPELGHGTNTLCIVGRRDMTKGVFLDRRAFLNSYDYRTDLEGALLPGIMRPLGPVCGGINLEYYFSRVDNYKLGAGTKLPHNVMGLFGVANSSDGDLRPGLPVQMIEVHDPVRLLIVVEHFPEVVLQTIQSSPEMYEWFINEWVHLVAVHPETHHYFYFKEGAFAEYIPLTQQVPHIQDFHQLVETARGMETNQIADATKENLPVFTLKG